MNLSKDSEMNYFRYAEKCRKPAMYRLLAAASMTWLFIVAAADAASAAGSSQALQSALRENAAQEFPGHPLQYVILFSITISALYNDLFYIGEQKKQVPVLSKYRFAPVDIRKMRRAKAFLLLRGACFFYIGSQIIYAAVGCAYLGAEMSWTTLAQQSGLTLIFTVCMAAFMLITERIRFHLYISQVPSRA